MSAIRARFARRLGLRALSGLGLLALFFVVFALGAAAFATFGLRLLEAGHWFAAAFWALAAAAAARIALGLAQCLFGANERPQGVRLERDVAPSLYALIDATSARLGGIRVHALWITGDMNAAVLQRPRWGLVGPMETHLLIGLPLVHSISDRQLGAILAHEYGHLFCQRHGLAAWGCHLRAWWFRSVDHCIDTMPLLGWCLDRWTLRDLLDAQTLARVEEFEADREAARVVGARLVAETLVEVAVKERFLTHDYWAKVMAQCSFSARPTIRPYREMGSGMVAGFIQQSDRCDVLLSMFAGDDDERGDLHPSLSERLEALREVPALATAVEDSVAERHLSPLLGQLAWAFDRDWWAATRPAWRRSYHSARRHRAELADPRAD